MASNEILSLARNQSRDQPALLFFELVGNDVCYPDPTLDAMTTPQEFYVNIMGMIFLPPKKIRQIQIFFLPKKNFNEKFFNVNLFEFFFNKFQLLSTTSTTLFPKVPTSSLLE